MWTHFFTLRLLGCELDILLRKSRIVECFTQRKNELLISTSHPSGEEHTLVISVDPRLDFLFIRERIPRARKNAVDIFPDLPGEHLAAVSLVGADRVLRFQLESGSALHVQLFGTAQSNVFLVENDGTIKRAFKKNKVFEGTRDDRADTEQAAGSIGFRQLNSDLRSSAARTIFAALKHAIPLLGSTYAREILHRAKVDENLLPEKLSDEDIQRIELAIDVLLKQSRVPHPTVYFRNDEPKVFSVVPLEHLSGARAVSYSSVNEAIRATVFRSIRAQGFESEKTTLLKKLKGEHERTLRALNAARNELARTNHAEQYERTANIILANLQHLTKGTRVVDLEDVFSEKQNRIRITMDPKLTPAQNAEQFFARAKKNRAAREETLRRVHDLQQKAGQIEHMLLHLDQCQTQEQVEEFIKTRGEVLRKWNIAAGKTTEERAPFRVFTVTGGFDVWAGKSGENNDLLTMRYAKPNDLWFHVRGSGGSHVVLRVGSAKATPSKEAIREAAGIAAYYSKMRNASMVPVAYCERKYVRKPKGADPGTVILQRENVIFVEPRLPS